MALPRPTSAYVPVGSEFDQGRPLARSVPFNGQGGVRKEWWWQDGPVDSCCCCFSLATGVSILAGLAFLNGITLLSFITGVVGSSVEDQIAAFEKTYADNCDGTDQDPAICVTLAVNVVTYKMFRDMPTLFLVQGFLETVSGMIGIWAVATHNARGAKLFMWTCLPEYLLELVLFAARHLKYKAGEFERGIYFYSTSVSGIIIAIKIAYYLKVKWSYYVTLKRRNRAAATVAESSGSIELDVVESL